MCGPSYGATPITNKHDLSDLLNLSVLCMKHWDICSAFQHLGKINIYISDDFLNTYMFITANRQAVKVIWGAVITVAGTAASLQDSLVRETS